MIDRETVKCECIDGFYGRYCEIGNLKCVQFFTFHINLFLIVVVNCMSRTRRDIRAVLFSLKKIHLNTYRFSQCSTTVMCYPVCG